MLAAQYTENSDDLSTVKVVKVPKPDVPAGCALVKIAAAAINPVDSLVLSGALKGIGWDMPFPFTMGYDFSGTVEALGGDGDNCGLSVGDQVFCVNWGNASHNTTPTPGGAFAQYIVVTCDKLSKKDPSVSYEEAAAIGLVGSTAYEALDNLGVHDGSSKRVLVLGGSSAVGSIAIQIAKQAGCWVATTCSGRTREYVESFGSADLIIDYSKEQWENKPELKGIDAVFDTVGEKDGLERAKTVLKQDGSFITIVTHELGFDPEAHPPLKFASSFIFHHDKNIQNKLMAMMAAKNLKVVVEKKFPFTQQGVTDILESQKSGKNKGKSVLVMD